MADDKMTIVDIAKLNATEGLDGLVDDTIVTCPELQLCPARTIKGTEYKQLVRVELPQTSFRNANNGTDATKGRYENRLFECNIFNPRWMIDKAIALAHQDGVAALLSLEADSVLKGAWVTLGKQFYYGAAGGGDALGHPGLLQMYDSDNMLLDAQGTTANTGSSVWAVTFGENECQWLIGQDGDLGVTDPAEIQALGENGKMLTHIFQEMLAHIGLKMGSKKAVARIKNLTAETGHGLTDQRLDDLCALFPAGRKPDALLMTRRSRKQLRQSRTATTVTGTMAPQPEEFDDIPIIVTDSLLNTEAIV